MTAETLLYLASVFLITSGKHTRAAALCEKMKTPLGEMGFVENKQIIKLHGICFLC